MIDVGSMVHIHLASHSLQSFSDAFSAMFLTTISAMFSTKFFRITFLDMFSKRFGDMFSKSFLDTFPNASPANFHPLFQPHCELT